MLMLLDLLLATMLFHSSSWTCTCCTAALLLSSTHHPKGEREAKRFTHQFVLFCYIFPKGRAHSSVFVFSIAGNIAGICFGGACIQDNRLQFKTVRAFPSFHTVRYTYSVFMNSNSAGPVRVLFLHIHHTVHPHAYDAPYKGSGLAACGSLPHPPSEHASPVLSL